MKLYEEFNHVRLTLLERRGEDLEAAELHVEMLHIQEAIPLVRKVLEALRPRFVMGTPCSISDASCARKLESVSRVETKLLSKHERAEVRKFW